MDLARDLDELYRSGLWHQALLHGQGVVREPAPECWEHRDAQALFWFEQLLTGSGPGWVPAVIPRVRVVIQLIADDHRTEQAFVVDPQRVRCGTDAYRTRLADRLAKLPLPFAGLLEVSIRDQASDQRLAMDGWHVEVGTRLPLHDPDVRELMAEHRRSMRTMRMMLRERDQLVRATTAAMIKMFRESASVIQASAGLVEKAAELRLMASRLEAAEVGPGLLGVLEQALPMLGPVVQSLMGGAGGMGEHDPRAAQPHGEAAASDEFDGHDEDYQDPDDPDGIWTADHGAHNGEFDAWSGWDRVGAEASDDDGVGDVPDEPFLNSGWPPFG